MASGTNVIIGISLLIIFFTIIVVLFKVECNKEGWINYYNEYPFDNVEGGCDKKTFYAIKRYRLPYDFPVSALVDYPVLHFRNQYL